MPVPQTNPQADPLTTVIQNMNRIDAGAVVVGVVNAAADATVYIGGQQIVETRPDFLYTAVPPMIRRLLGRDALIDDLITRLCGAARVLAAHGLPGVGKTTLAVALAHHKRLLDHFSGGVLWGALGQTPDIANVQALWGGALRIPDFDKLPPAQKRPRLSQAVSELRRPVLVILDDAWTIDAAQGLQLGADNVTHLLTTRNWSLATQFAGAASTLRIPELAVDPSEALLQSVAPAAWAADPAKAAQLAKAVGGLPLALELVGGFLAAPERTLFPELTQQAFAALSAPEARLALAAKRLGAVDGTLHTLENSIRLSLDDLRQTNPEAVKAFFALGAFAPQPARFERAAATAVSDASSAQLALLAARSLLAVDDEQQLALHQVLADLARLEMAKDAAVLHRDYYLNLVNEDKEDWQRIERVYPQIKFAWQQCVLNKTNQNNLAQFVWRLRFYQERRGLWQDKLTWAKQVLANTRAGEDYETAASMLGNIGIVYSALGEKQMALVYYRKALPLFRQLEGKWGEATTLNNIGRVYDTLDEKQEALAYYDQALQLFRLMKDKGSEATTLSNIGLVYDALSNKQEALAYYNQALPIFCQVEDKEGEAMVLNNIGSVYNALGEKQEALAYYNEALPLYRQVGDKGGEARALNNIGLVYDALGDRQKALTIYNEALPFLRQMGDKEGEATTLNNLGNAYLILGEKKGALRHYNEALPLFRQLEDKEGEATILNNMAFIYYKDGEYVRTIEIFQQVIGITKSIGALASESATLANLAFVLYTNLGQTAVAIEKLEASIAILERLNLEHDQAGMTLASKKELLAEWSGSV